MIPSVRRKPDGKIIGCHRGWPSSRREQNRYNGRRPGSPPLHRSIVPFRQRQAQRCSVGNGNDGFGYMLKRLVHRGIRSGS